MVTEICMAIVVCALYLLIGMHVAGMRTSFAWREWDAVPTKRLLLWQVLFWWFWAAKTLRVILDEIEEREANE